jgi:tetratricopeptide (TPR) repeat protein
MEQLTVSYNKALEFLHREQYDEAIGLLEEITLEQPKHPQIKWSLGLAYVMAGFPHKGLQLWKGIVDGGIPQLLASKNKVAEKLPFYEELYGIYNRALALVKENNFKEANPILKELLSNQKEVPLPIEFYQAYLLSTVLVGEEDRALSEMSGFPNYIRNSMTIQQIKQKLTVKAVPVKLSKSRKSLYGLGLVASLFIGAFAMNFYEGNKEQVIPVSETVPLSQEVPPSNYKVLVVELEQTVNELKEQQELLIIGKQKVEAELEQQLKVEDLLIAAEEDVEALEEKAGLLTYRKGLHQFKKGQYQEAIGYFEQSRSYQPYNYFSDDALFFLIEAKKRLNETDNLLNLYDQFIADQQSSPYYDDVLLAKAELLIQLGSIDEALVLLEEIQQDFPNEWTARRSLNLLKEIMEEYDANN